MNWIFVLLTTWAVGQLPSNTQIAAESPATNTVTVTESGGTTLPGMLGLKLMTETYTVEQVLAEIPSKVTGTSAIKLVATDGQQLVLERIGKNPTTYVAYVLEVEEFNPFMTTIKTEWIDANYDTDDDDLVIWYTTGNSNNGITGGYETERSGVMIINITDMTDYVHFVYNNQNRSYSEGPNANTEDENYHAKMDENSIWETCSYSYDVQMKEGDILVSKFEKEIEGSSSCKPLQLEAGKYEYDILSGRYELNR
ncbi:MAG: hypothetical protein IPN95_26715 [Bacteroidetes bacterium]|nr:hypothetical protein [Bacteroidota bacterium]